MSEFLSTKQSRVTNWRIGERVRVTQAFTDAAKPIFPVPVGLIGTLHRLERIQNGVEMWTFWTKQYPNFVGAFILLAAAHTNLKKED